MIPILEKIPTVIMEGDSEDVSSDGEYQNEASQNDPEVEH